MTDLRERIAGVLLDRLADFHVGDLFMATKLAEAVMSSPGIGVVELPEFNDEYGCFLGAGYPCNGDPEHLTGAPGGMVRAGLPKYMPPRVARGVAAALMAAANAAEETA